jgi:serine/alanine adding enzyme
LPGTLDEGLTEFKSHFNPNIDEYIGEFDLVIKRFMYFCLTKGLPAYKRIRKLFR